MSVNIVRNPTHLSAAAYADIIARSPAAGLANANATLSECLFMSESWWLGEVDGQIVCMWGLISPTFLSSRAYLWLLSTDLIEQHKFVFTRYSQRVIEQLLERYPIIVGHVAAEASQSIRWVKWLGAKLGEPDGQRIPFIIEKSIWQTR